jgi:hypothetical protein
LQELTVSKLTTNWNCCRHIDFFLFVWCFQKEHENVQKRREDPDSEIT